jgi:putative ABC transport system permease protein
MLASLTLGLGVAVFLAAIGLYGVIAHSVAERRREIGVRMALWATQGQVLWSFLRHGLVVMVVGIACGVIATIVTNLGRISAGICHLNARRSSRATH